MNGKEYPEYAVFNFGTMTIKGSRITTTAGAVRSEDGGVLTLKNCNITTEGIRKGKNATKSRVTHCILGKGTKGELAKEKAYVIVEGGTYTNNAGDSHYGAVINGLVAVKSGTFNGPFNAGRGTPSITGGTFSANPSSYVDTENYSVVKNTDNNTWTVSAK